MDYAVDLIIAVFCSLAAIPLLGQLRTSTRYTRFVDGNGNPIDVAAMIRDGMDDEGTVTVTLDFDALEDMTEETVAYPGRDAPPPKGSGWQRDDDSGRNVRRYLFALFGVALIAATIALIFFSKTSTYYVAWALFILGTSIVLAYIPRIYRLALEGEWVHPANYLHFLFVAAGIAAGLRLL